MFNTIRSISIAASLLPTLWAGAALAGSATLTLERNSLANITDTSGLNQYETGSVVNVDGTTIGYYNVTRRVTSAGGVASVLNAGSETMNVVLATGGPAPYDNLTLLGTHDYSSGDFAGSVAAASTKYKFATTGGATATISGGVTTLKLSFNGTHSIP